METGCRSSKLDRPGGRLQDQAPRAGVLQRRDRFSSARVLTGFVDLMSSPESNRGFAIRKHGRLRRWCKQLVVLLQ